MLRRKIKEQMGGGYLRQEDLSPEVCDGGACVCLVHGGSQYSHREAHILMPNT